MVDGVELVPREEALDRGQVLGRDTQDDKMLVRCRAERVLVHLGDLTETGLEVLLGFSESPEGYAHVPPCTPRCSYARWLR